MILYSAVPLSRGHTIAQNLYFSIDAFIYHQIISYTYNILISYWTATFDTFGSQISENGPLLTKIFTGTLEWWRKETAGGKIADGFMAISVTSLGPPDTSWKRWARPTARSTRRCQTRPMTSSSPPSTTLTMMRRSSSLQQTTSKMKIFSWHQGTCIGVSHIVPVPANIWQWHFSWYLQTKLWWGVGHNFSADRSPLPGGRPRHGRRRPRPRRCPALAGVPWGSRALHPGPRPPWSQSKSVVLFASVCAVNIRRAIGR